MSDLERDTLLEPLLADHDDRPPGPLLIPTLEQVRDGPRKFVQIQPPGSKSLTNRAMLLASLARGVSTLRNALVDADDAEVMSAAVERLGAGVKRHWHLECGQWPREYESLAIEGVAGRWRPSRLDEGGEVRLHLGNAGTAVRFLAGAALCSAVPIVIDGDARMRQRPIGELASWLARLGCKVTFVGDRPDCPPLRIAPPATLPAGASLTLEHAPSSQFISALLLVAPFLPGGLTLRLQRPPVSESYVRMTMGLLGRVGVEVKSSHDGLVLRVPAAGGQASCIEAFELDIEPDASGAVPFWTAAAMAGRPDVSCCVATLGLESLQGDVKVVDALVRMGASIQTHSAAAGGGIEVRGTPTLKPILADFSDMPDAAMALAVAACFAEGTSILRGLGTLRVKECDRIAALTSELAKIGVRVEADVVGDANAITVTPPPGGVDCSPSVPPVHFDTFGDHRMAMAFSLVGLRRPNTWINDPGCVGKTYPRFWRDLATFLRG